MHDDRLEQRLRSALQAEGDSLPFTITAEELRRRLLLRRRSRRSTTAGLLLAAAVAVGLVGVGAVAGGWFEPRVPAPVPSAIPSPPFAEASQASAAPSNPVLPASLAPLEAFLAPLDPARIVRAQAIGPASAPTDWSHTNTGPGSITLAPVTAAGSYRALIACAGADLTIARSEGTLAVPIQCDGTTRTNLLDLDAGDALEIVASGPSSWRFALLAPERPAPHAEAIASAAEVSAAAGPRLDGVGASERTTPDYDQPTTGSGDPVLATYVNSHDRYRVAVSCAGPGPLTYDLRPPLGVSPTVGEGAALVRVATTVECDGATHVDVIHLPFAIGADVFVDAPSGTAWRIASAFEAPPITSAKDGDGWTLGVAMGGLNLFPGPDEGQVRLPATRNVRLVVTCLGEGTVDVFIRNDETGAETTGSAQCQAGQQTETVIPIEGAGRVYTIRSTPDRAMWLIVTLQQEKPGG